MSNPIITVVNGKLVINGITFEHNQLLESKQYLQSIGAKETLFYPKDEKMVEELHEVIIKMGEITPEVVDSDILSYSVN